MKKTILFIAFIIFITIANEAFAGIEIISYSYQQAYTTGQTVSCTATVRNTESVAKDPYLLFAVTKSGATTENYGSAVNIAAGATGTLTATWDTTGVSSGKYSVTIRVYEDSIGGLQDTEYGAWPVRVGSNTETLSVFPTIIDFGVLPYGRHMHPVPIEITWDYFIYNRLRHQRPWYMRIYTDNSSRYKAIPQSIYSTSPAGLVSSDGRYAIPLKVWCLNYPPDDQEMGWDSGMSGPPPVDDDTYWRGPMLDEGRRYDDKIAWERIPDLSEMNSDRHTWRTLIGESIYDGQYATDVNAPGDFTLASPFSAYLALETNPTSVKGNYSCKLIIEIYSP